MKYPQYRLMARLRGSGNDGWLHFHDRMLRDISALPAEKPKWIDEATTKVHQKNGPGPVEVKIEYRGRETWCLSWFSHWTFKTMDAGAALASFGEYVRRWEDTQRLPAGAILKLGDAYRCLMGAEDRFRWSGADGAGAPCACEHCVRDDVWRINH